MKMRKDTIGGICISMLALSSISCDDNVRSSALTVDDMQEATVVAYFYADLDNRDPGMEYAPDGTPVIVSVAYNELNPSAGTGSWSETLEIEGGMVEATVPVTSNGTTVTFAPDQFITDQVQPHGSATEVVEKVFRVPGPGSSVSDVRPGQKVYHEVTYVDEDFGNQVVLVDVRFQGGAILMEHYNEPDTLAPVPQGTNITLYTSNWVYETTAGSDGIFEASVPSGENINIEFIAQKEITQDEDDVVHRDYKYETVTGPYTQSTPVLQTLQFGTGTQWE